MHHYIHIYLLAGPLIQAVHSIRGGGLLLNKCGRCVELQFFESRNIPGIPLNFECHLVIWTWKTSGERWMRCVGLPACLTHFACNVDFAIFSNFFIQQYFNAGMEIKRILFFKERNIFCLHVAIKITLFTIEKKG